MSPGGGSSDEGPNSDDATRDDPDHTASGEYIFGSGRADVAAGILDRLGAAAGDPLEISLACHGDAEFAELPLALQSELTTLLRMRAKSGQKPIPA